MVYLRDDFDQPGFLPLWADDRFHCILCGGGEVALADKTRIALAIFLARRVETGLFGILTAIRRSGE